MKRNRIVAVLILVVVLLLTQSGNAPAKAACGSSAGYPPVLVPGENSCRFLTVNECSVYYPATCTWLPIVGK